MRDSSRNSAVDIETAAFSGRISTDRTAFDGERINVIHTAAVSCRIATDRAVRDCKRAYVPESSSQKRTVALDDHAGQRGVGVVAYTTAVVVAAAGNRQAAETDRARCDLQHPRRAARVDRELIRTRAGDGEILADRKLAKREIDRAGD